MTLAESTDESTTTVPTLVEEPKPQPPAWRCWVCRIVAGLIAVAMAWVMFYLGTRNNDFPYYYHPDEFKKGGMIMTPDQPRTFAHPALMVEAAGLLKEQMGVGNDDLQAAVVVGRCASASMAGLATFGFALAGYRLYGFTGLLIGGATIALCPPLLVHAHYFKEDATLIGGVGLTVLGAVLVATSKPRLWTQLLSTLVLAIGCAAAASGKYVGVAMVAPSLLALLIARNGRFWHPAVRLVLFATVAAATFLAINHRAYTFENGTFTLNPMIRENVEWEIQHGRTGHYILALEIPNSFALRIAKSDLMPHVWAFAAVGALWAIIRHRTSRAGIVVLAFLLTWIVVLSQNAIPIPRYALPITVMTFFIGSLLLAKLVYDIQTRWPVLGAFVMLICVAAIVWWQGDRCLNFNRQFMDDSRHRLRVWVAANIPAGSIVAADSYTGLYEPGDPIRFPDEPTIGNVQVTGFMFAADVAGTLQALADSGVEYVAVAWPGYMRFLDPQVRGWPAGSGADFQFNRRRDFYKELFAKGEVLFQSIPNPPTHSYVNPEVTVYRIKHLARPGTQRPVPPRQPTLLQRLFG